METKSSVSNMTDAEQKLLVKMEKKNNIQLLTSNGIESCAIVDSAMLNSFNLFIGFINEKEKICNARYGTEYFSFPLNEDSHLTRVWLDCRETQDIKIHVNNNGNYHVFSEHSQKSDNLLIVFLECPGFVQLLLYDGRLVSSASKKVSHILTTGNQAKSKIRTMAYSMLNHHFFGLAEHLLLLDGKAYGKK